MCVEEGGRRKGVEIGGGIVLIDGRGEPPLVGGPCFHSAGQDFPESRQLHLLGVGGLASMGEC